ncbi:MAG: 3D-(3,5/4)-trihydroxycyclohexane-1,2-dione acylhydrolase (decyclizing) [Bacteroidetes bacterium]|nr:3D-(3,5/4)-trihydroxycyclohexane-1,2-dione acylhydrolase (decyclizing) [Bacteroidota bacterium]
MKTIRLTTGQALIKFLDNQYVSFDGKENKFVEGVFGIFGHGCVLGIGEALQEQNHNLKFYMGHNEQGMAHAAIAFAKQNNRKKIMAVTSSIGPGALNMVTAAGLATVNRIPVLFLPGDSFACRQPDPVLQQVEVFHNAGISANDAFQPVCRYWDRVSRPDQLMTAVINAMRVLTSPADTGAVCIALPQDVQAEAYDYPVEFFRKRVHYIERHELGRIAADRAAEIIMHKEKPIIICGGGARYSEAGETLAAFAKEFSIPFGETQAGKGTIVWDHPMNLGGIGVTGGLAANMIAKDADLVISVGSRLSDFTTSSKWLFQRDDLDILSLNVCGFDAYKMDAVPFICDAKAGLEAVAAVLRKEHYKSAYTKEISRAKELWNTEVDSLYSGDSSEMGYNQLHAVGLMNDKFFDKNAIIVGASGSLPGDLQRVWRVRGVNTYHMEYGFSCMGYEVSGAFGAKLAAPDQEVYAMVGDGSFVMLHSELLTSIQEGVKINIMLFDNNGFGCIDNLQRSQGIPKFGCELKYRNPVTQRLDEGGKLIPVSYAKIAEGYGCKVWTVRNADELKAALTKAKGSTVSTLIDIKVDFDSMSDGYESWWRVGTPEISPKRAVEIASKEIREKTSQAKPY